MLSSMVISYLCIRFLGDDLVQDSSNSIANVLGLLQACTNASMWLSLLAEQKTHKKIGNIYP